MDEDKKAMLGRLLGTELNVLKAECAQLSNDVREVVSVCEAELKSMCEQLLKSSKQVDKERDEAVKLYKIEEQRRRDYMNQLQALKGNIRVICRVRPVNKTDEEKGSKDIAVVRVSREVVRCEGKNFEFDEVFGPKHTNSHVFGEALPIVESVFEGFHACIFAYGQTGSGKTFTMSGIPSDRGVNYRAVERLFEMRDAMLNTGNYASVNFFVSNVEIYNETVRDLLTNRENNELQIRQDLHNGVHVPGCTRMVAESPKAVWDTMEMGQRNRAQALTKMNSESSRSHSVFMVEVEIMEKQDPSRVTQGKLVLVDLAGSERLSKSGVSGERQKEARCINSSLSALGDVIAALGSKSAHVPFRNSKLTYLLQDSMSKQNKVMMIVQTAPTAYNVAESLCTLGFGARARAVELGRAEARIAVSSEEGASIVAQRAQANQAASRQQVELMKQKLQLEQKVLQLERAVEEAEARAARAERMLASKDEQISRIEAERDGALFRAKEMASTVTVAKQPTALSVRPENTVVPTENRLAMSSSLAKRQAEKQKAMAQVKARQEEHENRLREVRTYLAESKQSSVGRSITQATSTAPLVTPRRQVTFKRPASPTLSVPSSIRRESGSMIGNKGLDSSNIADESSGSALDLSCLSERAIDRPKPSLYLSSATEQPTPARMSLLSVGGARSSGAFTASSAPSQDSSLRSLGLPQPPPLSIMKPKAVTIREETATSAVAPRRMQSSSLSGISLGLGALRVADTRSVTTNAKPASVQYQTHTSSFGSLGGSYKRL